MNKMLLRSFIVKFDGNQENLAKAMGISHSTLSAKMNEKNGAEFRQKEIEFISRRYHLTCDEICNIFFAKAVS